MTDLDLITAGYPGDLDHLDPREVLRAKCAEVPQIRARGARASDDGGRVITYVASDETPDRMGDVIKVSGWDLASYKRNPVVLWGHDSTNTPPIGRAVNVRRGKDARGNAALMASIEFAPAEAYEFAETVYQLSRGGFLNAVSVGFMPKEVKEISEQEKAALGMPAYGVMYSKASLLEISVVSVPANPSALATGAKSLVDQGVLKSATVDRFLKQVPMTEEELSERLRSKIRGFVDLGALAQKSAPEPEPEAAAPEEEEAAPEAATEEDALADDILAAFEAVESEAPEQKAAPTQTLETVVLGLIEAQSDQAKALTTLVDSISDLTKRIREMGGAAGEAKSSDAQAPDAQQTVRVDNSEALKGLTNDFINRLNSLR
jgi:HK97 family phage prohead protease